MIYTDENRGKIQNRGRARQQIQFDGMRFGNITPTDIDGMFEYHDKAFVFYEVKHADAQMPYGQQIALERIADAIQSGGKEATVFLCRHYVNDTEQGIRLEDTIVTDFYYAGRWYHSQGRDAKEISESFIKFVDGDPF